MSLLDEKKSKVPYIINPYDSSSLSTVMTEKYNNSIESKKQIQYIKNYLKHIETETILIENDYIDKAYLEDYSEYYVRCFFPYERSCKRIHFFRKLEDNKQLTSDQFDCLLMGNNSDLTEESLQKAYLGFVVVKPLPETIIGRTCLITYNQDGDSTSRKYIKKNFDVGLFGLNLKVTSLPFQEQDRVVSACATSALWSMLYAIKPSNSIHVKSPSQITEIATQHAPLNKKAFPASGLTPEMMGHVLLNEHLEAYHFDLYDVFKKDESECVQLLKENVYAYIKNSVPLIFGVDVYEYKDATPTFIGRHAITICGYTFDKEAPSQNDIFGLVPSSICNILVHDDQIGPYARLSFSNLDYEIDGKKHTIALKVAVDGETNDDKNRFYVPNNLIIGLYHKIRIPYSIVREGVKELHAILANLINKLQLMLTDDVKDVVFNVTHWDIYLTTINKAKKELFNASSIEKVHKRQILTTHHPKYIWVATAHNSNDKLIELWFDATDIPQGDLVIAVIKHSSSVGKIFDEFITIEKMRKFKIRRTSLTYKIAYKLQSEKTDSELEQISLNQKYGVCRPPSAYKPHEFDAENDLKEFGNIQEFIIDGTYVIEDKIKYIWTVNHGGKFLFAPEIKDENAKCLGHPNLTGGEESRISGELFFCHIKNTWIVNSKSGRYSKFAQFTEKQLENVITNFVTHIVTPVVANTVVSFQEHCEFQENHT